MRRPAPGGVRPSAAAMPLALRRVGLQQLLTCPLVGVMQVAGFGVPPALNRLLGQEVGSRFAEQAILRLDEAGFPGS